ncbi:hypothetical protein J4402_01060 [Candidatus Pacearchaeota archaeon]|nr:hypothetical protein [Candidatus Pacearchaeota archaeon]
MNNQLILQILKKKELSGISKEIVKEILESYLNKNKISSENLSPKQAKIIIKEIRSKLRNYAGQFQKKQKNRQELLERDKLNELLKTHTSTAERLNFYPELKKLLTQLKIKSVLDIGCGINPIALANKKIIYYAVDIKQDEIDLIKKFFRKNDIRGKVFPYNLLKINLSFPKADICLLFKILDTIEKRAAERILKSIKSKYILASFSTKTLSNKKMNQPRRYWFEHLLKRINLEYRIINSENEIFYLIKQQPEPKTISLPLKPKTN